MKLQPVREPITTQKEFLHTTQGLINKVGGVTLGPGFTGDESGMLKGGSAVMINANGLAVAPTFNATTGAPDGLLFVTANDVKAEEGAIVGAHESAYLNSAVVGATETGRVTVTQQFIDGSNGRFHLR